MDGGAQEHRLMRSALSRSLYRVVSCGARSGAAGRGGGSGRGAADEADVVGASSLSPATTTTALGSMPGGLFVALCGSGWLGSWECRRQGSERGAKTPPAAAKLAWSCPT